MTNEKPEPHAYKTLRDEFAMAALTGLLALDKTFDYSNHVMTSYKIADAMLKARKK
jgi:hypothetical protein